MGIISGLYHHRIEGEQVLVLLQKNLSKQQVNQTHSQLITKGHLLPNPNNLKWLNTLLYNALIRAHVKLCDPPKAFILFTRMLSHQAPPNNHTFPCLIKASTSFNSPFHAGTPLHSQVIKRGCCLDPFILTSFVALYGHFGYQLDAHKVFEQIPQPCIVSTNSMLHAFVNNGDVTSALSLFHTMPVKDVVSWTSIISGLANNRCFQGALAHFKQMLIPQSLNLKPNEATLVTVLSACANSHAPGALCQGKQIHAYIIKHNLHITVFLGTALISMYGKTGSLQTAATIFNAMKTKQVCTWNAIISSLSSNGKHKEAFTLFQKMKATHGIQPNEVTLVALLASCARTQQDLVVNVMRPHDGSNQCILAQTITDRPNPKNTVISCTKQMMKMARAGELNKAFQVFEEMPHKNQVSWNAMLTLLVDSGRLNNARQVFGEMPQHNSTSYTLMIKCLSSSGCIVEARKLFDSVPVCHLNVILWTTMLSGYTHNHKPMSALELFLTCYGKFFEIKVIPNSYTFSIILKASLGLHCLIIANQIHSLAIKLLDGESQNTVFVQNALIDLHLKLGDLGDAEKIFNGLKWKDLSSFNILMDGYVHHKLMDKAWKIFNSMREKDVISFNIMFSGFSESGLAIEALQLFLQLLESQNVIIKPNSWTYTIVLTVCATFSLLDFGVQMHAFLLKFGMTGNSSYIDNSLLNMYAKCGCVEEMQKLFIDMSTRNVVSWNSIIAGLGQNGCTKKALEFAEQALKLGIYNQNTFIGLLASCSHGGLVNEGMEYFISMTTMYGIEPSIEHYNCVIDMLGRMGKVVEAYDILQKMPFKPNVSTWATVLNASLVHGNEIIGEIAAREVQKLEPKDAQNYVMLAKIYGCTGEVEKCKHILSWVSEIGLKKGQGLSWILK